MKEAKKVALVTGANKGIGFEVARQIARAGWTVLAAARNEERGKQAAARLQRKGDGASRGGYCSRPIRQT